MRLQSHRSDVRRLRALAFAAAMVVVLANQAVAQLDPLLFLKRVPPNVIIVLDTSFRMLDDGEGDYYDPHTYTSSGTDLVAQSFGLSNGTAYRRRFTKLTFNSSVTGAGRYSAETIVVVPELSSQYGDFWKPTRFQVARDGIKQAVAENSFVDAAGRPVNDAGGRTPRWGLVKLPQAGPAWATQCDVLVTLTGGTLSSLNDLGVCPSSNGGFGIYAPSWSSAILYNSATPNSSVTTSSVVVNPTSPAGVNHGGEIYDRMALPLESSDARSLKPAGADTATYEDRPITLALKSAKTLVSSLIASDSSACRNTIVVLVTGGENDGPSAYLAANGIVAEASSFSSINGRRVPIYVVGVNPQEDDEEELENAAGAGGGRYFRAESAADVARAINLAVQAGFGTQADFTANRESEFLPVSPIVGTVNLEGARDAAGTTLPPDETEIYSAAGIKIPQRNNFMITAGFALGGQNAGGEKGPGFDGRLRAFRVFKPAEDASKASGYRYEKDGTRLWPDVDGRPETAGLARTPANPDDRNVFTYIPGSGVVAFSLANSALLGPHLGGASAEDLIPLIRELPLGAIVGSTPAIMDAPSIDPPPDDDYGRPDAEGSYAGVHKNRRTMIWFGANDGMIHGIDARTGFEVWAFIPFNLLPKLRTLADGQPIEQFEYFVDSSPKIAEVKIDGAWKSLLLIGQGPGGVFYQAFDVTEAGMGGPAPDDDGYSGVLATFANPGRVRLLWSFPDYSDFDTSITATFALNDGTPGGRLRFYGDLRATASQVEKSVGFAWSDPAVGALNPNRSTNVAILGSGYFPPVEDLLPGRGPGSPRAGRTLYLLDLETGKPIGNPAACTGTGCLDVGDALTPARKNALQADPTAGGLSGDFVVTKAYMGDLDGTYWRFDFTSTGGITKRSMADTGQPIYSSSALVYVGTIEQYVFFSTGSDQLPTIPAINGGQGPFYLHAIPDPGQQPKYLPYKLAWPAGSTTLREWPSSSPSVAGDIVFFTTTVTGSSPCTDFEARLYAFNYRGGGAYGTTSSGGSGRGGKGTAPSPVATMAGRATAPFVVDQHLYFATSGQSGAQVQAFGDPNDFNNGVGQVGVRVLSWRELR